MVPSRREKQGLAVAFAIALVGFSAVYFALPGMWGPQKISGDGWDSYALARSMLFDRDVDLANEIAKCCNQSKHSPHPVTKRIAVAQPMGTPILWLPFLAGTQAAAWVRSLWHPAQALDGYGDFHFIGTAWASVAYGLLGLLFVFLFLRRHFSVFASTLAVVAICFATPLFFYVVFHPSYSHSTSMFAVSLFVWEWDRRRGDWSVKRWAVLGLLTGLVALVRAQDVGIALLPIAEAIAYLFRRRDAASGRRRMGRVLRAGLVAAVTATVVFLPQLLTWRYQFGGLLAMPQGSSFMQWGRPTIDNAFTILFGSRNGLLPWHPVYGLAGLGLLWGLVRAPRFAVFILIGLLWQLYVNVVVTDLWGGWSFGHRRLLGQAPLFAWGIAFLFDRLLDFARSRRRRPVRVLAYALPLLLTVPLVWLNTGMTRAMLLQQVVPSEPRDMKFVYRRSLDALVPGFWSGSGLRSLADATWAHVGNPASAPGVLYFRLMHGVAPRHFDLAVGNYLLYRFAPNGDGVASHLQLDDSGVDKYLVEGKRAHRDEEPVLVGKGSVRLALPTWLLSDGVTVVFEVPRELHPTLQVRFNGDEYKPAPTMGRDALKFVVPRERVRWGFNELELEAEAPELVVRRLELSSRH